MVMRTTKGSPVSSPTTLHDLPDKLLELILLRLTSPLWLVRAAATCKRWRRVAANPNFLRHIARPPHLVAGHYHYYRHHSKHHPNRLAFVPSPTAAFGANTRRFSLEYLPGGSSPWELIDSHRSLLLLAKARSAHRRRSFPDLVVCEPVTRRFKLIPRMEEMKHQHCLAVFLHDHHYPTTMDARACSSMSTYRVICVVYIECDGVSNGLGAVRACVFDPNRSTRRSTWNQRPHATRWYMVKPSRAMARCGVHLRGTDSVRFLGHAARAWFWSITDDDTMLVLDECTAEFEILRLPECIRGSELRVVVDGDGDQYNGKLCVICLDRGNQLRVFATWRRDHGNGEWVLEKSLRLAAATAGLAGYKEGYFSNGSAAKVVTANTGAVTFTPAEETWMFSVDLKTMEVAHCKSVMSVAYPCELPWLPTLRA
ncbi:hypothetical protein GUJ93_ZPchr0002g23523, partial [Zizania palustris]